MRFTSLSDATGFGCLFSGTTEFDPFFSGSDLRCERPGRGGNSRTAMGGSTSGKDWIVSVYRQGSFLTTCTTREKDR
jgi:hypothetical protein